MGELDTLIKFNRGLILSLADENVYEAIRMYREYVSLLTSKENEEYKKELTSVRFAFLEKLFNFVSDKNNFKKTKDMISAYQELISNFPDNKNLYQDCSVIFEQLKQYDIQIELLEKANKLNNENNETIRYLIEAYKKAKRFEEALKYALVLKEREPDIANNYCVLGDIYHSLYATGNNEENLKNAILNMEIAHKMQTGEKTYLKNLTVLYLKAKDEINLKRVWEEYIKLPMTNIDLFDYAAYLIRHKDFKRGFELYQARFKREIKPTPYPDIKKPLYDGKKDISKNILLVQWEQGLGDAFLFSRFLFELKNKEAKIILRTQQKTLELLKNNFKFAEVISSDEDNLNKIRFDYHIPLMSIPMAINLSPDNISHTEKYISANDEKAGKYKEKFFKGDKFKIGFSYQGSTVGLATRDIELKFLEPLFNIPNTECYMLQYKIRDEIYKGMNVKNLGNNIKDFDDTAAMIENMDLIVTTDNSILNLAGAMGKKTFALFNNVPEFRWFDLTGDDVKWYKSVKPYIADKQNNWAPLIQKVKSDIEGLVK